MSKNSKNSVKVTTSTSTYKGKPVIELAVKGARPFSFGVAKAQLVVANIVALRAYAGGNESDPRIQVGESGSTYMTLNPDAEQFRQFSIGQVKAQRIVAAFDAIVEFVNDNTEAPKPTAKPVPVAAEARLAQTVQSVTVDELARRIALMLAGKL